MNNYRGSWNHQKGNKKAQELDYEEQKETMLNILFYFMRLDLMDNLTTFYGSKSL